MGTLLTIFTATFNRRELLGKVYASILAQNDSDIEWVIMDDGSSDGTRERVQAWISENKIKIKYYSQSNQGRFAAYNNARQYFDGELMLTVDSDNILLPGATRSIRNIWEQLNSELYSGIIAYMQEEDSEQIEGTAFPKGITAERIYALYDRYHLAGDKFLAFRTDLVRQTAYPIFPGEKFGGDSIVFNAMNEIAPMYLLRQCICKKGMPEVSITSDLRYHHLTSPNGMREHYRDTLAHEHYNKWHMFKHAIGYIGYARMTAWSHKEIQLHSPKKWLTEILFSVGQLYYRIILARRAD